MRQVTDNEVRLRLQLDNPWWRDGIVPDFLAPDLKRAHFEPFYKLVTNKEVRRAVVLMGPRRVGKTVLIHQTIQSLIIDGASPKDILYLSLDTPVYTGLGLEKILRIHFGDEGILDRQPRWVFFDEVQYLKDWERHLKSLVDALPNLRFTVSGSAAAALRLKSSESGAGRFTDFMLPSLAFCEYLNFVGHSLSESTSMQDLNSHFFDYMNFGGFPETVLVPHVRNNMDRFIRSDILDKVLLRDLPDLYGIDSIQDLNRLFTVIAYNTSEELSYDGLSQSAEMAKNTVKKYIDYLESAFLIIRLPRIDQNAKRFKRDTHFKIHLANPSIRAALFGPITQDDDIAGNVVESAIISQIQHLNTLPSARYARWGKGEVDLVGMAPSQLHPFLCMEIKWSDRYVRRPFELAQLADFAKRSKSEHVYCTSRTLQEETLVNGTKILHYPAAFACYDFGMEAASNPLHSLNWEALQEVIKEHKK